MKGIPSDQIQDTILRNGLGEGNRKETGERETRVDSTPCGDRVKIKDHRLRLRRAKK